MKRIAARAAEYYWDNDQTRVVDELRRHFAQRPLVDEQLNPRVVMQVGGWDSF